MGYSTSNQINITISKGHMLHSSPSNQASTKDKPYGPAMEPKPATDGPVQTGHNVYTGGTPVRSLHDCAITYFKRDRPMFWQVRRVNPLLLPSKRTTIDCPIRGKGGQMAPDFETPMGRCFRSDSSYSVLPACQADSEHLMQFHQAARTAKWQRFIHWFLRCLRHSFP